jgi:hypothetical protein
MRGVGPKARFVYKGCAAQIDNIGHYCSPEERTSTGATVVQTNQSATTAATIAALPSFNFPVAATAILPLRSLPPSYNSKPP